MTRRPDNIDDMCAALAPFMTDEGYQKGINFAAQPTDVFISPYPKCGTTWMQQIVHGLRSSGDMDFSEITEAVPWVEMAHDMGVDPGSQLFLPRAFKSHLSWDEIPKGGKYINVFRDPVDAMLSLYRFFDGWFFEPGTIGLEAFADYYLTRNGGESYWGHTASWWRARDRADVMCFSYEQMKGDLPIVVTQVADFIGIEDPQAIKIATHQAGFDFMKAHAEKYDDHLIHSARDAACGLPPGTSTKVDKGAAGKGKLQISSEIRAKLDAKWQAVMTSEFGLEDYTALIQALVRA